MRSWGGPRSLLTGLNRAALVGDDHSELAVEDPRARLAGGERLAVKPGGTALHIAQPRRMQLRGGRTWTTGRTPPPILPRPDPVHIDGLRRAHVLAICDATDKHGPYERALRRSAFLSSQAH